jgi:hypothetical protein
MLPVVDPKTCDDAQAAPSVEPNGAPVQRYLFLRLLGIPVNRLHVRAPTARAMFAPDSGSPTWENTPSMSTKEI